MIKKWKNKKRIIQKVKPELMPRISARPLPFLQVVYCFLFF